jgi:hypothetical protein
MDGLHDHDLGDFADFTEIEMIQRNLHTPSEHPIPALTANESTTVFNSLWENEKDHYNPIEDDNDIAPQQPLRPVLQVEWAYVQPQLAEAK